jgi:hypothetical protein
MVTDSEILHKRAAFHVTYRVTSHIVTWHLGVTKVSSPQLEKKASLKGED